VADFFLKQGHDTHVLVHRDSDCLLPDEIEWYLAREAPKLPGRCRMFFTPLTDVEHQFCQPAHIASALNMPPEQANALVEGLIDANAAKLAVEFSQKRMDLKAKILREKEDVPPAAGLVQQRVSFHQVKGKKLWGILNQALIAQQQNPMHLMTRQTDALKIDALAEFAAIAWPPVAQAEARPAAVDRLEIVREVVEAEKVLVEEVPVEEVPVEEAPVEEAPRLPL
jgi:hypothetical protein